MNLWQYRGDAPSDGLPVSVTVHKFAYSPALTCLSPPRAWFDSSVGVHTFLTFDSAVPASEVATIAPFVDFVWGCESGARASAWTAANPHTITSQYIPYSRDPDGTRTLAWWMANHPTWVVYKCDRVSPAVPPAYPNNIPFDISNPEVLAWQVANYALPAYEAGFAAIAADEFNLGNYNGGCGVYNSSGAWVPLYSGEVADAAYEAVQLQWLQQFQAAIHSFCVSRPMYLVPNFVIGTTPWNATSSQTLLAAVDGVLDERGFTGWGLVSCGVCVCGCVAVRACVSVCVHIYMCV